MNRSPAPWQALFSPSGGIGVYNACKAYANQLVRGEQYERLLEVIAITFTDFVMFPKLRDVINTFRMSVTGDVEVSVRDQVALKELELIFVELPKFRKTEQECVTTLDRWLWFMCMAGGLEAVPATLAVEPAIVRALELANRAALTPEEEHVMALKDDWIRANEKFMELATVRSHEASIKAREEGLEKGREEGLEEGLEKGLEKGRKDGKAEALLRLLRRRFAIVPAEVEAQVATAGAEALDAWFDAAIDGAGLETIFSDPLG